jgi:RNA polymerase sigma factor (sigma-70 family)
MRIPRDESDELAPYFQAIRRFPPLSRAEEHDLAVRARVGDVAAKQTLVHHNLAFVLACARKHCRGSVCLADLVQEGSVGLLRAVEKYDPDAGTRFLTYAAWWIRAHMGTYMREARSAVRSSRGTLAQHDVSLDERVREDDETFRLERVEDSAPGPEAVCVSRERDRIVRDAVIRLRKRIGGMGYDIVRNRLAQDTPKTLDEIGKRWGLSRERARQVEVKAKRLLQRRLASLELDTPRNAA